MDHTQNMYMHMSLHVILLYPHGAQGRGSTGKVYGLCCCHDLVSAAVRPLCAVGLSGSCQAVTLGPDSDGSPLMSCSAVRLSDTTYACCQTVGESAVNAVRLSGTVRRCPGFAVVLSDHRAQAWVASVRPRNGWLLQRYDITYQGLLVLQLSSSYLRQSLCSKKSSENGTAPSAQLPRHDSLKSKAPRPQSARIQRPPAPIGLACRIPRSAPPTVEVLQTAQRLR